MFFRDRQKVDQKDCGDTQESSQGKLILASDRPSQGAHSAKAAATRPFCESAVSSRGVNAEHDADSNDTSKQRPEEDGQERSSQAHKSAHHRHHFYIAESHAFEASDQLINGCCAPQEQAAKCGAENAISKAQYAVGCEVWEKAEDQLSSHTVTRRDHGREKQPCDKPRPRNHVRQKSYAQVRDGENDDQAGEEQPLDGGLSDAKAFIRCHEEQTGGQFN